MPSLDEVETLLDDLRPHPVVRRFALEVADSETVWSERTGGSVSLRATAEESPAAILVYKERVEVCLAPERAREYGNAITGSRLFTPNATTSHWVIPAALLVADDAMRAALEAVAWRRHEALVRPAPVTPTRTRASRSTTARSSTPRAPRTPKAVVPERPPAADPQCPIHFIPRRICECNEG
ncbi:hypothetical protein [Virgisporangium aliadipatigenens]|uniref:hypothetical protein n=1 Tax=Virgisporangium aliadipatigenens TaxID=741659 RepID=UPI0019408768|nr:hypothetical protein [Virgisporangium aliadipatigenens]